MTADQNLTFGWAQSPDDQLWHRVQAVSAMGDDPSTTEFHSACGLMFEASHMLGSKPVDDERPRCATCETADQV